MEPLLFIYDNDPVSRKQARKHVSKVVRGREHRQRSQNPFLRARFIHQSRNHRNEDTVNANPHSGQREPPETEELNVDRKQYSEVQLPPMGVHHSSATSSSFLIPHHDDSQLQERPRANREASTVSQYFSATRTDPFCTLPVPLDSESAKCLDHFNTSMPYLEFCVYDGAPLIPSRHVAFRSALETPAAVHAIVATGATHLASLYGVQTSHSIQYHIGQALTLLRANILAVDRSNWSRVAQTMTEIAAGDDFRGQIQNSRLHLNGLRELMGNFGGIERLQDKPKVQLLTCYVLNGSTAAYFPIIRCARGTFDKTKGILCNDNPISEPPKAVDLLGIGLNKSQRRVILELSAHMRDFCTFMNRVGSQPDNNLDPSILRLRKILPHYFYPENKLRRRLSIAALDQERFGGLGPKGNHRMSCLFTIVLKLLRLSDAADYQGLTLYLEKLQYLSHPNVRLLQFILMQDGTEVQMNDATMSWEVVRLTQVYKLMGEEWRRAVNAVLVGFLNGEKDQEDPEGEDGYASSESPEKERFPVRDVMEEVLGAVIQVIGEQPLLGSASDLELAPTEDIREVT